MVVTRFPPSPTGHLHLGGARTALFNYLFAKHQGGKFILRFEDTDKERSKEEYVESIISALEWLGLKWDEGPYFQSKRFSLYQEYAQRLYKEGKAYYCECSKELLEARKKELQERGLKPRYDGTCRNKNLSPAPGRALRIKVPEISEIIFEDLLRGKIVFPPDEVDDFIILRSDGSPTYQFAVVVDDITMGITHVIRGDDHISNTPKQLVIYRALGVDPPLFAHIPMVLGPDGNKLSKRHGARSILEYKEEGYLPQAIINYLARLGWGYGDQEFFTMEELIEKFDLQKVNLAPARFDPEKLLALNGYWIRTIPTEELLPHLKPFLLTNYPFQKYSEDTLVKILESIKPRVKTLKEMAEMMDFYFYEELSYEKELLEKYIPPKIKEVLKRLFQDLNIFNFEDEKSLELQFRELAEKEGIKLRDLAQALRIALTGKPISPPLFEVMKYLGRERVKARIERVIKLREEVELK